MTTLAEVTTMGVGGSPTELIRCNTRELLIETAHDVWRRGEDWLVLGGGSNIVANDDLSGWHVLQVATKGVETSLDGERVLLKVQAGENWDDLVAGTVQAGLAGLEALSGIPGSVGASPVQNIGAYGQEIDRVLTRIEFLDYQTYELQILERDDLNFGYRDSILKQGKLGIVTWVEFELENLNGLSKAIASTQLAAALGLEMGDQVPLQAVRDSVLKLRAAKGMVYDQNDIDSHGCGSFFTNPIVSFRFANTLGPEAPRWEVEGDEDAVKLSAAWLIEQSGIPKGFALARSNAAVSSKHSLAITNRGGATATEVVQLASFIQQRVMNTFGVNLVPEPNLIGF